MYLPDLAKLTNLTALNLSDNRLTRVPPVLSKLKQLQFLDLSCNSELQVCLYFITYFQARARAEVLHFLLNML